MPLDRTNRFFTPCACLGTLAAGVAALALGAVQASQAAAQAPAPTVARAVYAQPDVQVLIVSNGPTDDLIDLTYPGVITPAQAERDVNGILRAGGWRTTDVNISNEALPTQGAPSTPMTSVTFETAGASPQQGETTLRLEPWIIGLKSYRSLAILFIPPSTFQFNGLQHYQDEHVAIALDQEKATYTYHVSILDGGQFTSLGLPLTQQQAQLQAQARSGERKSRRLVAAAIIALGLAAAGIGYAIYMLLARVH